MKQKMVYNLLLILLLKLFYLFLCCHVFRHILLLLLILLLFCTHITVTDIPNKVILRFFPTKHSLQTHLQLSWRVIWFVVFCCDIRSNIFTVTFLIISEIHTLEYGLLILLQFPLHFFTLILYGKVMYSIFTTTSLTLHS